MPMMPRFDFNKVAQQLEQPPEAAVGRSVVMGSAVAYLLYDRRRWRTDVLTGVYLTPAACLAAIGQAWPSHRTQRLYAAYENGFMRQIFQTGDLIDMRQ